MHDADDIAAIRRRAKALRLPIEDLCGRAGLSSSTLRRNRDGMRRTTLRKLWDALRAEERGVLSHLQKLHPEPEHGEME
jgi:transcriptional regulator with XRE-family HTH domain